MIQITGLEPARRGKQAVEGAGQSVDQDQGQTHGKKRPYRNEQEKNDLSLLYVPEDFPLLLFEVRSRNGNDALYPADQVIPQ